jgi:hemerythrin-like metal-binding protein
MPFIAWKNFLSVGHERIDSQHKNLVEIINGFYNSVQRGADESTIPDIIEELLNYARSHFEFEEEIMRKAQYPDLENHRDEHRELTDKVIAYKRRLEEGARIISAQLLDFLKDWLVNHLMVTDKDYAPYVQSLESDPEG